jgi:GAF domain-containing protein
MPHGDALSVFLHDISEVKAAELRSARLAETQGLLRRVATAAAANASPDSLFELVCQGTARVFDAHSCWALRFTEAGAEVVGASVSSGEELLVVGETLDLVEGGRLAHVRATGSSASGRPGGRLAAWGLSASAVMPIRLYGRVWGALSIGWSADGADLSETVELLSDLAELIGMALGNLQAWATIERHASTDALTGLANLRSAHARVDDAVARARRHGHPVALGLVDIDHFKDVNDGHGHHVGDKALCAVADALRSVSRERTWLHGSAATSSR